MLAYANCFIFYCLFLFIKKKKNFFCEFRIKYNSQNSL